MDALMTHQRPETNSTIIINIVSFESIQTKYGLEITAQITVPALSEQTIRFKVNLNVPETKKASLSLSFIERVIKDEVTRRFLPALIATFRAVFVESVDAAFDNKPVNIREKVLKIYENNFNQRNKISGNGKKPISRKQLVKKLVDAWLELEKRDEKTKITRSKLQTVTGISRLSKKIDEYSKDLKIISEEPTYKHFLNVVRHEKEVKQNGKEKAMLLPKEVERWIDEFSALSVQEQQAFLDNLPAERRIKI